MYTIPIDEIIARIKEAKATRVALQLPDGLKPRALELQRHIRAETSAEVLIWAGTNFGACDQPVGLDRLGVDLVIHLGHTEWVY